MGSLFYYFRNAKHLYIVYTLLLIIFGAIFSLPIPHLSLSYIVLQDGLILKV